jgi:SdrD B-like domain
MRRLGDGKGGTRRRRGLMPVVERCEDRQLLAAGLSSLSGFVYCDVNNDGLKQTGEPVVVGATVVLGGTDSLGAIVSETTTTDSTGAYHFTSLAAGTYSLQETPPTGSATIGARSRRGRPARARPGPV